MGELTETDIIADIMISLMLSLSGELLIDPVPKVVSLYFALQQMPLGIVKMIISSRPVFTILFAR